MPRPVFDIEQYELRGLTPEVYTKKQKDRLTQTLARANGQIDWTAQLLGFNGANYWGRPNPKVDGSYDWIGLPETMNEKRQMQTGAFGVYNKHLPYEQWPSPFNRSEIKAVGDARISIFESGGETIIAPLNLKDLVDFSHDPVLYLGGSYEFNAKLELSIMGGGDVADFIKVQKFQVLDSEWTRLLIKEIPRQGILIKIEDSDAVAARVEVIEWSDSSDWNYNQVKRQFYGIWGNKGASLSFDFAFDALDLHGFDEKNGLGRSTEEQTVTLNELLSAVGLKPTIWTPFSTEEFGFKFNSCPVANPTGVLDPTTYALLDQEVNFQTCVSECNHLVEMYQVRGTVNEECDFTQSSLLALDPSSDNLAVEQIVLDIELDAGQCSRSPLIVPGIEKIKFEIKELDSCAKVGDRCLEWVWDPTLNNGTLEDVYYLPENPGPWAIADDGEYGVAEAGPGILFASQEYNACENTNQWTGFDDGIYEEPRQPDCPDEPCLAGSQFFCVDIDNQLISFYRSLPLTTSSTDGGLYPVGSALSGCDADNCYYTVYDDGGICDPVNGGFYAVGKTPDYSDCDCNVECCDLDGGNWTFGTQTYASSELVNGGIYLVSSVPSLFNGGVEACPLPPVRLNIFDMVGGGMYAMKPSMRNAETPLRVWKSQILSTTDTAPATGSEFWNYLVADENRGPQPETSFRHYVRLPLEYERDGKEWNRAVSVCNNQSYFSATPEMPVAHQRPDTIRPVLYADTYWRSDIEDFVTYYDEDYLVSSLREDTLNPQNDFEDSRVSFEQENAIPYAYASVETYDPFDLRAPNLDGSWRGSYYINGANLTRTGYVSVDAATANLLLLPYDQEPIYDKSPIELPVTAFPESSLQAPIKNYSVSYAYFVTDFSAADDPVFDPDNQHCWRSPTLDCQIADGVGTCDTETYKTNTAYRLHHYGELSDPILV